LFTKKSQNLIKKKKIRRGVSGFVKYLENILDYFAKKIKESFANQSDFAGGTFGISSMSFSNGNKKGSLPNLLFYLFWF
jgi:hypothetical protein